VYLPLDASTSVAVTRPLVQQFMKEIMQREVPLGLCDIAPLTVLVLFD
jgi:hypothetical protein